MKPSRLFVTSVGLGLVVACSDSGSDPTGLEVVIRDVRLPVATAAYLGSSPHLFSGGAVRLTCSSHGGFTSGVEPPLQVGASVVSDYTATFVGELVLQPPLVRSPLTFSLGVQARMAERITLRTTSSTQWIFDTELVTFELQDGMPTDVVVRQNSTLPSVGVTTVTGSSEGVTSIESYYDVWLDISLDNGQSWIPADGAIRMTLQST